MRVFLLFNKYKDSIKNLSVYFTANIVQVIVGLIMSPIIATYLTHYDFSVIGYFNSFNLFVYPFIGFSFFSYYAKNYFQLDIAQREKILSTLLISQAIFGLCSVSILLGCLKIYFVLNSIEFDFLPYSVYTFGTIYFSNFYTFILIHYKLSKNPQKYIRLNLFNLALNTISTLVFVVLLKKGANGNMGGLFLASILIGSFSFYNQVKQYKLDFSILKDALKFSWPLMFSAFLTYFYNGFDRLLLEKQNNFIEYGLYNVAYNIAGYFSIFTTAINSTFEPDFYLAISKRDNRKLIRVIFTITILTLIPILGFLLMGNWVVGILTNYKYVEATNYTRVLVFSNLIRSISFSLSTVIIAYGFTKWSLIEKIIGSIFAVIITLIFIHEFSFYGGAWAQSIVYLVQIIITMSILVFLSKKSNTVQLLKA